MRTSSMKSRTAVATLVITLTFAVPYVEAKPARSRQTRSTITIVTQLIQRYFGIKTNGDLPVDPRPIAPPSDPDTTTTTTTTTTPSTPDILP